MTEENQGILEQESVQPGGLDGKTKQKRRVLLMVLIPILLLSLFLLYRYFSGGGEEPEFVIGANVQEGTLNTDNGEEEGENGRGAMSISLNGYPVFENGESEGNLNIVNPANNVLYMEVQITLDETGEVIYESGGIPPGHFIDNDKLTTVLEQGEHSASALVRIVDPENLNKEFNSANFDLLITVKS